MFSFYCYNFQAIAPAMTWKFCIEREKNSTRSAERIRRVSDKTKAILMRNAGRLYDEIAGILLIDSTTIACWANSEPYASPAHSRMLLMVPPEFPVHHMDDFSRLNSSSSVMAVYVSCQPLYQLRKTHFRWLTKPCRAGMGICRNT